VGVFTIDTVEKATYCYGMQKSKEYCWICDNRGFTYELSPYYEDDVYKEVCVCQLKKELPEDE